MVEVWIKSGYFGVCVDGMSVEWAAQFVVMKGINQTTKSATDEDLVEEEQRKRPLKVEFGLWCWSFKISDHQ